MRQKSPNRRKKHLNTNLINGSIGHIGQDNDGVRRVHEDKSMGVRNQEGESALDFAVAFDMAILNTFFTKSSYRMYRSGPRDSQIDFLLYRRDKFREVEDCKVL